MRKIGEKIISTLMSLLSIAFGLFVGLLILGYRYSYFPLELPLWEHYMVVLGPLSVFLAGQYLKILVHEGGHLVFGLLSGYRFVSFRMGSTVWIRQGERIARKRYSLPGTGGQCLMSPPELVDGKMPVYLYNMGGCIANLIAGAVFFVLCVKFRVYAFWRLCLLLLALDNVHSALINGIPLRSAAITNDGYNAVSLGRDPEAIRALWVQLRYGEELAKGVRLRDMPQEWFRLPGDERLKNRAMSFYGAAACFRLLDQRDFAGADALIEWLTGMNSGISQVQKGALELERVFLELIGENRPEELKKRLTKDAKRARSIMKKSLSVIRLEYALAMLAEKDSVKAQKQLKRFEKAAKHYPYTAEIESERELIALVQERAREKAE